MEIIGKKRAYVQFEIFYRAVDGAVWISNLWSLPFWSTDFRRYHWLA